MVWARDENIGGLCRKERDGYISAREEEERKAEEKVVGRFEVISQGEGIVGGGTA